MSDSILDNQIPGNITVTSRSNSGALSVDRQADGGFGVENSLVAQTARERNTIRSRGRGIARETTGVCECPSPARLVSKPSDHCANCGGILPRGA
jgi:hypothetical protein